MTTRIAIALGSNIGDRANHLNWALGRLKSRVSHLQHSTFHETVPVGVDGPQGLFLNAAAVGETSLSPEDTLTWFLGLEQERGRVRTKPMAPRTLDLDLILYGDLIVTTPTLVLPHPRFRERLFVLEPLGEIAPDWIDPVTGLSVTQLISAKAPA